MYIHKCTDVNYPVHSDTQIKQEHIFTEYKQDMSNTHTKHANETGNQLYYIM
jgi:hypothetical protein